MTSGIPGRRGRRASILSKAHDYCGGAWYFVTICSFARRRCFGRLTSEGVRPSAIGHLVLQRWAELDARLPFAALRDLVVMPDHLHGIIEVPPSRARALHDDGPRRFGPQPPRSLGVLINLLKGGVTRRAREFGLIHPTARLWHRGYHDRIIRGPRHLANARAYIRNNPARAIESARKSGIRLEGRA